MILTPGNKLMRDLFAPLRNSVGRNFPVLWTIWRVGAEFRHQAFRDLFHDGDRVEASRTVAAVYDHDI
jgi:hypothetical protein